MTKTLRASLFLVAIPLVVMILLASGWYLSRRFATSEHADAAWLLREDGSLPITYKAVDARIAAALEPDIEQALRHIEAFFGHRLPHSLTVHILPDRAALDAHWRDVFRQRWFVSICWMVGAGTARELSILSPRVWGAEDCGHDPNDRQEISRLIKHELTHVYHDQVNPSEDIGIYDNIGWFIEGLAVHVSGQLEGERLASPEQAIEEGSAPAELERAWSGRYRYGVSGSMVAYIDHAWGRATLLTLMRFTSEGEILRELGVSEAEFIAGWQAYVLG